LKINFKKKYSWGNRRKLITTQQNNAGEEVSSWVFLMATLFDAES